MKNLVCVIELHCCWKTTSVSHTASLGDVFLHHGTCGVSLFSKNTKRKKKNSKGWELLWLFSLWRKTPQCMHGVWALLASCVAHNFGLQFFDKLTMCGTEPDAHVETVRYLIPTFQIRNIDSWERDKAMLLMLRCLFACCLSYFLTKTDLIFFVMKIHVTWCRGVTHWCVFNSFWTTSEPCSAFKDISLYKYWKPPTLYFNLPTVNSTQRFSASVLPFPLLPVTSHYSLLNVTF